jgi:dipeptidyl-peptidase 4
MMMHSKVNVLIVLALLMGALPTGLLGQLESDDALLTVERIFDGDEFNAKSYAARWLEDTAVFTTLERSDEYDGRKDIVRHDPATGESKVMVAAAELIPAGDSQPLEIEGYSWSKDQTLLLVYTNSKRVWRRNTRGDYWVLDRASRQLRKLGGDAASSTLMFAKFSPDGTHIAYVRERDIYVEDLLDHSIKRLTQAESDDVINGTADWVYEEELALRDGYRWSPDSQSIAFWQINTEGVERFTMINNTDTLYPEVIRFPYPKVGQKNPSARIGVVDTTSGETRWVDLPGDADDHYIPRMQWAGNSGELLVQRLNRHQNRNRLFLADFRQGEANPILTEEDEAWVDMHDELKLFAEGKKFTWISERDGWRHVYIVSRSGGDVKLVTPGEFDVIQLLDVDEENGRLYFIASPEEVSERYLYRVRLDGSKLERVTPDELKGTHSYQISPDARWAIHQHSSTMEPPTSELITLRDHSSERMLEDNQELNEKLRELRRETTEFFRVDIGDGVELEGWCIKPPNLDPSGSYPLLVHVYGEPAGTTVVDRWGGGNYLWHLMLAQRGYVVMSFDNRGTKAPRGRAWRKSIYHKIGILPPQDQAAAVRAVLKKRPYLDPKRVGIWGWSGGGSSSLQAVFKYPDLYKLAIAVASVPNQRYYDTIYQERFMGLPDDNVEGYREGSPINFAKQLKGDLLLIHGTGDDNCHYQTVEMLIDELVAHKKQFSLMAYPNRTHAIRERKNTTVHMRELMTRFLLENLPAEPAASRPGE